MTRILAALFHVERFVDASITAANAEFLRVEEYVSDAGHITDGFCTACIALDEIDDLLSGLNLLSGSTHYLVYRYDDVDMCPSVSSWLSAFVRGIWSLARLLSYRCSSVSVAVISLNSALIFVVQNPLIWRCLVLYVI